MSYIKGKLGVLVPSQIRALRLKSDMPKQADLAKEVDMQQSRISIFETPGAANVTLETLAKLAAIFKVGLIVKFVPFSEMLHWENTFSQDDFNVTRLDQDVEFLTPTDRNIWTELAPGTVESSGVIVGRHDIRLETLITNQRATGATARPFSYKASTEEAASPTR
jgi:transcriptional regulator with XRE-family HTH domain